MLDLAPGNILQRMHFRRRLRVLARDLGRTGRFVELGTGSGWLSELALEEGWTGVGFDPNPDCAEATRRRNTATIAEGRYEVHNRQFDPPSTSAAPIEPPADLVFSCMVLEHLTDDEIHGIVAAARLTSTDDGVFAAFVPAGMRHWGIEDDVAGHLRRYEPEDFAHLAHREALRLRYRTGLTFPLSNLLKGVSDRLVARTESSQLERSLHERTLASGHREVPFKTRFPAWTRLILNEWTLLPFDLLQRLFGDSRASMVAYGEWELNPGVVTRDGA